MPRIEEVQFVHWGSLRPDPVPLLTDGINVCTGPNGSGKTCFLDGVKCLLGITSFAPGRSSTKYIFDGGPGGVPAERAWLRGTLLNPVLPARNERLFAAAPGCQDAERVSIVCLVSKEGRRYRVLPGRLRWGFGRPLEEDLAAFLEATPEESWLGPRKYTELLERIGITRALREVLALPQGAIDRIVEERPQGLLRNLLELTGERSVLEAVRSGREGNERARAAYLEAIEQNRAEKDKLAELQALVTRHLEWAGLRDRLQLLREVARPAAEYRDLAAEADKVRAAAETKRQEIAADQAILDDLGKQVPALEARLRSLEDEAEQLAERLESAAEDRRDLDARIAALQARLDEARAAAMRLAGATGERDATQAEAEAKAAEQMLQTTLARRREVAAELAERQAEAATLEAGGVIVPDEVEAFRQLLEQQGVQSAVVAELLEVTDENDVATRAEAALGDALWALVVPADAYRDVAALAASRGYRYGIVRAAAGEPRGVLAQVIAPSEVGLLLETRDALAALDHGQALSQSARGHVAVTGDGMHYSEAMARLQAPARPVLGRNARDRHLAALRDEIAHLSEELAKLDRAIPELRAAWLKAMRLLDGARSVADQHAGATQTEQALKQAKAARPGLIEREAVLHRELRKIDERRGAAATELDMARKMQAEVESRLAKDLPRLTELESRLAGFQAELAERALDPAQQAVLDAGDLPGTESLLRDLEWLQGQVDDEQRFPPEVRDEGVLAARDAQARVVAEHDALTEQLHQELEAQQTRAEASAHRFDQRVRRVTDRLSVEFARICQIAGWRGELHLLPGERPDDYGLDVLVAQRPGDRLRSYRDATHSGGQRATIAIVLLLAAMGAADAADLLLMDEHIAHLDSTNIDHVAALMHALGDRVQFLLATPTNAESLRLSWCDLQLAFLPRDPGRAYSPPIRLLSRLGIGDLETRLPAGELAS